MTVVCDDHQLESAVALGCAWCGRGAVLTGEFRASRRPRLRGERVKGATSGKGL